MNTAAKAISWNGLRRRAFGLGAVKTFDHATHFLLPVVLTRCLDAATFGEYRLLWLIVGTLMTVATLNMAGGLFFFVPRSDARGKRLYIHQTMLFLAASGLVCGALSGPWNPLLPAAVAPVAQYGWLVPAFVALWVAAILLDFLPTIDERIRWQAFATGTTSVLRVALVGAAAWFTGELRAVLWMLLAFVLVKLALLLYYVHRHHGLGRPWFERAAFGAQFSHCAPFGVSNALYSLRAQTDQWVAASLFALTSFAAFSVAAIVGHVVQILRHSVMEAFMPTMSRMQAAGDVRGMMAMNSRANAMVGTMLYPLLALAFAFAEDIITLVYTAAYLEAAPVMRVYVVGMLAMVVEVGSIVLLLRQGPFALRITALVLPVSVAVSWLAAHELGLAGAAAGSVVAIYLDRALLLRRVARHTGIALRELQAWRALGRTLALAAACGLLAWFLVQQFLGGAAPLVRLAAGATILALAYVPLWRATR
ncbi:MAG TPA: oligosaccharide flippase family protein [Burkholderiales bacterium]|nr:oligosaccharide flippase family protein [Burkholderiales bacterium]